MLNVLFNKNLLTIQLHVNVFSHHDYLPDFQSVMYIRC